MREFIGIITAFALVVLLALCAGRASAEEVYVQPEPLHYEAVRAEEVCDRDAWVTLYQSALATRATPEQARSRANAIVRGCNAKEMKRVGSRLHP